MIIGIVGYFTVPTVAGWIVSAGGTTAYNRNLTRAGALTGGCGNRKDCRKTSQITNFNF